MFFLFFFQLGRGRTGSARSADEKWGGGYISDQVGVLGAVPGPLHRLAESPSVANGNAPTRPPHTVKAGTPGPPRGVPFTQSSGSILDHWDKLR